MNPQSVLYLTALMELGAGLPTLLVPNGFVSRRIFGKMTGTSGQLLWSCLAIAVGLMCYSLANTGNSAAISSGLFGMLAYHILLVGLSVNSFLKKLTNGLYSRNHELPDPLPVFVAHGLMGVITYFSWQASGAKSVW